MTPAPWRIQTPPRTHRTSPAIPRAHIDVPPVTRIARISTHPGLLVPTAWRGEGIARHPPSPFGALLDDRRRPVDATGPQLLEHGREFGPVGFKLHRANARYRGQRGFADGKGGGQSSQGLVVEHGVGGLPG